MNYQYKNKQYSIIRYPSSESRSLRAWSAADEHILKYLDDVNLDSKMVAIYNDRFGFLSSTLNEHSPLTIINYKSQEKACLMNLNYNKLKITENQLINPLRQIESKVDIGLIKIPKSLDLFRLYLDQLSKSLLDDSLVICSFMTRHFSAQMLSIAEEFFEQVEQSKAWKKSRLIILKKKKEVKEISILNSVKLNEDKMLQQYFGVFSSNNIDHATLFLIEHLNINEQDKCVLDLGSGNGVLATSIRDKNEDCDIHLLDDSFLAIKSSRLNLKGKNTFFHYNDGLDKIDSDFFDFVISNPPFHFEYETNIEVSLRLFKEVQRCLKVGGRFQLVANKHLNYKTHLTKIFKEIRIIAENEKFVIYECLK